MEKSIEKSVIEGLVGDSHRYKNQNGEISMIHPCAATMGSYEIYCIEGELFDDVERFSTLEEAENRVIELLGA